MSLPREDVYCPVCPDLETAFRLEDVGMKVVHQGLADHGAMRIELSRPVWEPVLIEHLRSGDDKEHRRLYDLCVTELIAAGQTAEEAARSSVHAAMNGLRRQMDDMLLPGRIPCCGSHNQRCEPPGDLCCHDCTEASHNTFPVRHADGSTCVMGATQ